MFLQGREDSQTLLARVMEEAKGHIRDAQVKAEEDNKWLIVLAVAGLHGFGRA